MWTASGSPFELAVVCDDGRDLKVVIERCSAKNGRGMKGDEPVSGWSNKLYRCAEAVFDLKRKSMGSPSINESPTRSGSRTVHERG